MRRFILFFTIFYGCFLPFSGKSQCTTTINAFPYSQDFEGGAGGWSAGGVNNSWALGAPTKPVINSAGSGANCWVTGGLAGSQYSNSERSFVQSPCFNFTTLARPTVFFKIWWESEFSFDGGNFQYSLNAGGTWLNVGTANEPAGCYTENWFNHTPINFLTGLANPRDGWSGNVQPTVGQCQGGSGSGGWVTAKHCLGNLAGQPSVKFRFTFGSGTTCNAFDGIAFDDFHLENAPPPTVDFTETCLGNTFSFDDNSTPCITQWNWNFGDPASGAANISTLESPAHTYSTPGIYTVSHGAGNTCVGLGTQITQQLTVLGGNVSTTPVSCNGGANGTATVLPLPAAANATVEWSTAPPQTTLTATGLSAGDYDVVISAPNACSVVLNVTITEPNPLGHTVATVPATCNQSNGSAIITMVNGTPPFMYNWQPSGGPSGASNGLAAGDYTVIITDNKGCTDIAEFTISSTNGVSAGISAFQNINCFGGNNGLATAFGTGGMLPYTYLWSNAATTATISNVAAGTYTVTITDNKGCTDIDQIVLTQPTAFAHSSVIQNAVCSNPNGSATVTVTGGTPNYTYLWTPSGGTNPTASNLISGNYILSVTDSKGCKDTVQVAIGNAPAPTASISASASVSCFGGNNGSATVVLMGGTPVFTYLWSPGGATNSTASNLPAGTATVTVTDSNGCTTTATTTISQPSILSAATTNTTAICGNANGSATVTATGGTPNFTYLWSPSGGTNATATNLISGIYSILVTDNKGCTATASTTVGNSGGATISSISTQNILCFGQNTGAATVNFSGGNAPITFIWSNGSQSATAANLAAGPYSVTLSDANGCTATSTTTISQPTKMAHTTSAISASCGLSNGSASVSASGGVPPYNYIWSPSGGTNATASNLSAGVYIVSVNDQNSCLDTAVVTVANPTGLQISVQNSTNVSCFSGNNGSAAISATNGTTPYIFSWNTPNGSGLSATNLTAGLYAVTVTDASACSATASISITQPADYQQITTIQSAACGQSNGSATVNVTGGTGAISYIWSPSGGINATASGLAPGNYVVSISDQNNCKDTIQVVIGNAGGVLASILNTTNVQCFGGNDGSATASATGGTPPFSYKWPNGATTISVQNLGFGSATVTISDALGCTSTATANITQPAKLMHVTSALSASCGNPNGSATVVETGGTPPFSYVWSPSGGTNSTAANLAAGNFVVSIIDSKNCLDTAHILVGNFPAPTVSISNIQNIKCFGENTGAATAIPASGTSPFSFVWGNNLTTATISNLTAGQITVTVTDAKNCTATATANLTQPTELTHTVVSTNTTCGAPNGSATITATGGIAPYKYLWSPIGGTNMTATGLIPNNYTCSVTDANGCLDTVQVQIFNTFGVTAGISATVNVACFGQNNGSATASASNGIAPISFKWPASAGNATTPTALNLAAGTYVVTVTDGNNCSSSATATISQPSDFVFSKTIIDANCGGTNGSATVAVTGATAPYLFNWTPTGGNTATANLLAPGNYICSISDQNGCKDTVKVQILNTGGPNATILATTEISCFGGNNGTATVAQTGGATPISFKWGNNQTTATATNLPAGNLNVTVTDANGCTSVATANVTQPAALEHAVLTTNVTCVGANGTATITETGGKPPYIFTWDPAVGTGNSASGLNPGNYVILVLDANNCPDSAHFMIKTAGNMVVAVDENQPKCANSGDGSLVANVSGGLAPFTVIWSNGATDFFNKNLSNGQFFVTVTDATGCTAAGDGTLFVEPISTEWVVENAVCFDEASGKITADTSFGGTTPYQYGLDNNGFSSKNVFVSLKKGQYQAKVRDANGCEATTILDISQPAELTLELGLDTAIILGNELFLSSISSDPNRIIRYQWSPATLVACDSCPKTVANPLDETTIFQLIATDANGCTAADELKVTVQLPPIYIPNAFSPNFDGDNDEFTVYGGAGVLEIESLRVFDRWGDLVFQNRNFAPSTPALGWNGLVRKKDSAVAVYVYVAKVKFTNGKVVLFKGDVTVVR